MVTSFYITTTSRTDMRLFEFLSFPRAGTDMREKWNQSLVFSGVRKNPNPRAHRSSGKRGLPSFPLKGGPEGWDFSGTTEHQ